MIATSTISVPDTLTRTLGDRSIQIIRVHQNLELKKNIDLRQLYLEMLNGSNWPEMVLFKP